MQHLWTLTGKYFGYLDGDNLWTQGGKHIGKLIGDEIYSPNGHYMGEIADTNRLIAHPRKQIRRKPTFTVLSSRAAVSSQGNKPSSTTHPGYVDPFSS